MQETKQQNLSISRHSNQLSSIPPQCFVWLMALACALWATNLYYSQQRLALT